jgi:hypothetical protein
VPDARERKLTFPVSDAGTEVYLEFRDEDGDQPVRSIYWLYPAPRAGGWSAVLPSAQVREWSETAVANDFETYAAETGEDKRTWRLVTRYAAARYRRIPEPALGILRAGFPVDTRWSRTRED